MSLKEFSMFPRTLITAQRRKTIPIPDEPALGVLQKGLREIDDLPEESLLFRDLLEQFGLHQFSEPEALGDGKDEGKDRDD